MSQAVKERGEPVMPWDQFITEGGKLRQANQVLAWLQHNGSLTSLEAREMLGILHPAGRVLELRKRGWHIETQSVGGWDAQGRPHKRNALYVLKSDNGVAQHG